MEHLGATMLKLQAFCAGSLLLPQQNPYYGDSGHLRGEVFVEIYLGYLRAHLFPLSPKKVITFCL